MSFLPDFPEAWPWVIFCFLTFPFAACKVPEPRATYFLHNRAVILPCNVVESLAWKVYLKIYDILFFAQVNCIFIILKKENIVHTFPHVNFFFCNLNSSLRVVIFFITICKKRPYSTLGIIIFHSNACYFLIPENKWSLIANFFILDIFLNMYVLLFSAHGGTV
jgi:hypothetical protein